MTRRMKQDQGAYRAVITTTWEPTEDDPKGRTVEEIAGPYGKPAAAKSRITIREKEADEHNRYGVGPWRTVAGRVQRATAWEDVPDDEQGGQ